MELTRKYTVYIVLVLISGFLLQMAVSTSFIDANKKYTYIYYDFEDNAESNEDNKIDNELNNYPYSNLNQAIFNKLYVSNCLKLENSTLSILWMYFQM